MKVNKARTRLRSVLSFVVACCAGFGSLTHAQPSIAQDPLLESVRDIVSEPREMLELFQIGASQLELFSDGEPLSDDGLATIVRLLFRAPSFPPHKVHRWRQWKVDLGRIRAEPNRFRGAFLRLAGRVTSSQKIVVPKALRQRFALEHFYRVTLDSPNGASIVYCRSIPATWVANMAGSEIDGTENVGRPWSPNGSVSAMFVKIGDSAEVESADRLVEPPIVAVANAFAWHPTVPDEANGVSQDYVRLAKVGMDVNQFSFVQDRKPLSATDRECFYQLLDASAKVAQNETLDGPDHTVDVTTLLQNPESHRGREYAIVGTVRRAVKIQVDDIDIVERFGIEHYYELEVFTNPDVTVRFVDESGSDKVFTRYPIVVCSKTIPDWLPQGADVHANVRVSGFFLKHWAYKTQYMSAGAPSGSAERLQISPLLVGTRISPFETPASESSLWGLVGGATFVMALVAVALFVWSNEKSNRGFRQRRRSESTVDLDSVTGLD